MGEQKRPATLGSRAGLAAAALIGLSTERGFCGDNFWTGSGPLGGGRVNSLAVDPAGPRTVYAATLGGIFKSTDGGTSWESLNATGSPVGNVTALAIHPAAPATLYTARCSGSAPGVVKTIDGGSTWAPASTGLVNSCVESIAINPLDPLTIYAGTGAAGAPFGSSTSGVFRSTDGATSWRLSNSGMGNESVLALAIDPVNPSTIYAGVVFGGVFKSTNRGDRWSQTNAGLPTAPNPFDPNDPISATIEVLAIDPDDPSAIYAGVTFPGGIYRSASGGGSWTTITPFADSTAVLDLVLDPSASSTVYAVYAAPIFGVWRSPDRGASWSGFSDGLTEPRVSALAIDRTGTFLYSGTFLGEVFAFHIVSPRLHISLPASRATPRLVSPRP